MSSQTQYKDEVIAFLKTQSDKAVSIEEIEKGIHMGDADEFKVLVKSLVQLEERGKIIRTKRNLYGLPENMNHITGRFQAHEKGFGFVIPEDKTLDDVFIPPRMTNNAMNGDTVMAEIMQSKRNDSRQEGVIIKIIERGTQNLVGLYTEDTNGDVYVVPDDKKLNFRIQIIEEGSVKAVAGHKVVVTIKEYPESNQDAKGYITSVIGHKNDPGVDILSIVHGLEIDIEFPDAVIEEANRVPDQIDPATIGSRRDLRAEMLITIDGESAKDLDDAVSAKQLPNGNYELGVHIADVSHYVTEGSELDTEAAERGTSVYLVDRVIPMIPHRLSNGICSLNPKQDRFTLSCVMEIDKNGSVVRHEIFESVINTTERMTYTGVNQILTDRDEATREQFKEVVPMVETMEKIAQSLRHRRDVRGSVDFDIGEAGVIVDENGHPTDVVLRTRGVGEKMIEEFMLAANETVAEHFNKMHVPFIYRVHEEPKEDRLQTFFEFITNFGITVQNSKDGLKPSVLQEVLDKVKGKPEELVVSTVMLRSMQQARYDVHSLGHFGLSTEYYTHFTSPIRSYPDLMVHRLIRSYLINKQTDEATMAHWNAELPEVAEHTSKMERRAIQAERATDELKKTEFMLDKIGEVYKGVISSATNFGLFVSLENTIEGLIHISALKGDYFNFNPQQFALIGERSGKVYRIGDEIMVKVEKVDVEARKIDFSAVKEGDDSVVDLGELKTSERREYSKGRRSKKPLNLKGKGDSPKADKDKPKYGGGSISGKNTNKKNNKKGKKTFYQKYSK